MAIKVEMLRYFVTVVESGSLESAALVLNRTPSAVSMMLKQFEETLGLALFASSRKNKLTPAGQKIYTIATREVAHFEQTIRALSGVAKAVTGSIKIAVTPSIASAVLPVIMRDYIAAHPHLQIEVRDMTSLQVVDAINRQQADVGIACCDDKANLYTHHLFSDRFGFVCRKDHPTIGNKIDEWGRMTWADIQDAYFIVNDLCKFIQDPDFVTIRRKSNLSAPNTASLLGMIRAGIGVSILPELAAIMLEPDLCFLPLKATESKREIYLLSQPLQSLTPAAKAFVGTAEAFDYRAYLIQKN